jgi:hypothetical protein
VLWLRGEADASADLAAEDVCGAIPLAMDDKRTWSSDRGRTLLQAEVRAPSPLGSSRALRGVRGQRVAGISV